MISWRKLILQFLCFFVCRLHLTEAHCSEELDPKYWKENPNITFNTLRERIKLVKAHSFEDMINCTLGNEVKNGRFKYDILYTCMDWPERPVKVSQILKDSLNCGEELKLNVSFFDFICLIAKASNAPNIQACSHDVVVSLYRKFNLTPTTLPATKQPPSTTKLTTTTARSTTAEMSTQTSPPPVTTWSTRPSTSNAASESPTGDVSATQPDPELQTGNVVTDRVVYSLLGLSVLLNLLLAFCVALLWSHRRSNHRTLGNSATHTNGHTQENLPLVTTHPVSELRTSAEHTT